MKGNSLDSSNELQPWRREMTGQCTSLLAGFHTTVWLSQKEWWYTDVAEAVHDSCVPFSPAHTESGFRLTKYPTPMAELLG